MDTKRIIPPADNGRPTVSDYLQDAFTGTALRRLPPGVYAFLHQNKGSLRYHPPAYCFFSSRLYYFIMGNEDLSSGMTVLFRIACVICGRALYRSKLPVSLRPSFWIKFLLFKVKIRSSSTISRIIQQGFPAAIIPAGISFQVHIPLWLIHTLKPQSGPS